MISAPLCYPIIAHELSRCYAFFLPFLCHDGLGRFGVANQEKEGTPEAFVEQIKDALEHLSDLPYLQQLPLTTPIRPNPRPAPAP